MPTMFIFTPTANAADGSKAGADQQVSNQSRIREGAIMEFTDYHCPTMQRIDVAENGSTKTTTQKLVTLDEKSGKAVVADKRYLRLIGTIDGVPFNDIAPSMFVNPKPSADGSETYTHEGEVFEAISKALTEGATLGQQGEAVLAVLKGKKFKLVATHTWWVGNYEKHIWDLVPNE